jgi:hypothetical protein
MTRVSVSGEISARIAARITAYPSHAPQKWRWLTPYGAQHGALPLYVGWTEAIGIRSDGELVSWSTEGDFAGTRPVNDPWLLTALVAGANIYAELRPLLPIRGPDAVDCHCRAIPMCVSGIVGCAECAGLGWLPGADRATSYYNGPLPSRRAPWYQRLFIGWVRRASQ